MPRPNLAVVRVDQNGEIHDCPGCRALEHEIEELQRKMRGLARELGELRSDRRAEAEADPLWPLGLRLFRYHARILDHPRAEWTAERFAMIRKLLKQKDGLERCLRAIAG